MNKETIEAAWQARKKEARIEYGSAVRYSDFVAGMKFGYESARSSWTAVNRENDSLRWILMRDRKGVEGIRLGKPEDGGWRLVDENGKSTWQPHHDDFYLAEMSLNPPTDAEHQQGGE